MLQFVVALLGVYIGLSISFEQLSRKIFQLSKKEFNEVQEAKVGKVTQWFSSTGAVVGIIAFVMGIIIFIAPTPTSQVVDVPVPHVQKTTQRFLGDLLPAITLILAGLVSNKKILGFFNFKNASNVSKFSLFLEKYGFWIGIATMFFGFLHLILGSSIFF